MPNDPTELMRLAAQVNGLGANSITPWHLKATYQVYDDQGQPKEQGTLEEWWVGRDKYKVSYTSSGFNHVEYRKGGGTLLTGDRKWPPMPDLMVSQVLLDPLPVSDAIKTRKFSKQDMKSGNPPLQCLRFVPIPSRNVAIAIPPEFPAYCFGKDVPAIRLQALFGDTYITFNKLVRFQGQYVAQDIQIARAKRPLLSINVTGLELLNEADGLVLDPPDNANPAPPRQIAMSPGAIAGLKISGDPPIYPLQAKERGIQGTVVLTATVGTTGEIGDLQVVSGPPELQRAALESVKTWRYQPFLINHEAFEVKTQLNVIFQLGGR